MIPIRGGIGKVLTNIALSSSRQIAFWSNVKNDLTYDYAAEKSTNFPYCFLL
jgi:hypothetical protein